MLAMIPLASVRRSALSDRQALRRRAGDNARRLREAGASFQLIQIRYGDGGLAHVRRPIRISGNSIGTCFMGVPFSRPLPGVLGDYTPSYTISKKAGVDDEVAEFRVKGAVGFAATARLSSDPAF